MAAPAVRERVGPSGQSYTWRGIITTDAALHQGGDGSDGTIKPFVTQKIAAADGASTLDLPYITGNSIRGQWRDVAAHTLLALLGVEPHSLGPAAFYFLFAGGSLSKGADGAKALDIGAARSLGELVPSVALFGGGVGTMLLPGKLKVADALPLCLETAHIIPEPYRERCKLSIWALRDMQQFSRMDDARRRTGMDWLAIADRTQLEAPRRRLVSKAGPGLFGEDSETVTEAAPAVVEQVASERGTAVQMRYGFETLAIGTLLYHSISVHRPTPVELSALHLTLAEWSRDAHLGGRSAQGWGAVTVRYDRWLEIGTRLAVSTDMATSEADLLTPERYYAHVAEHDREIRQAIDSLGA